MFNKDYAICSQEELEEKRQMLEYLKDDLKYLSVNDGGLIMKKLEILELQGEILESECAIAAKEAGRLSYVRYRIGRVCRNAAMRLYYVGLDAFYCITHLIFRFKMWLRYRH